MVNFQQRPPKGPIRITDDPNYQEAFRRNMGWC